MSSMPRALRQEREGGIYHVFARGVNRGRVFVDREDYSRYLGLLAAAVDRHGWNLLAYCLMPNHVHLVIETPQPNLSSGMQWLQGLYAQEFNERHSRVGHLFQGRFRDELADDPAYLETLVGYVALNPVAAVLCSRPEDWPWSSHFLVSAGAVPKWLAHSRLLKLLGDVPGCLDYRGLVEARWTLTAEPNPQVGV
jgi:REP element-mobilizing transposase RayT